MNRWAESGGLWLLDFYLLATVLLGTAWVGSVVVREPARRLVIYWGTSCGLLLLVMLSLLPGWARVNWPIAALRATTSQAFDSEPAGSVARNGFDSIGATSASSGPAARPVEMSPDVISPVASGTTEIRPSSSPVNWPRVLVSLFLIGVAVVALRLAWGARRAVQVCRSAVAAPPELQRSLSRIAGGDYWLPRLLISPQIPHALALGAVRPTIVLPTSFTKAETTDGLDAVLAHELGHIRNGDLWLLALNRLLSLLLYAHPLFLSFRRWIRDEQEVLADAAAVGGRDRIAYVEELARWSRLALEQRPWPWFSASLGITEGLSQLDRRIRLLLSDNYHLLPTCSRTWRLGLLGLFALITFSLSVMTLRAGPAGGAAEQAAKQEHRSIAAVPTGNAKRQPRTAGTSPAAGLKDDFPDSSGRLDLTVPPRRLAAGGTLAIRGHLDSEQDIDVIRVVLDQSGPVAISIIPRTAGLKTLLMCEWQAPGRIESDSNAGSGRGGRPLQLIQKVFPEPDNWVNIHVSNTVESGLPPEGDYVVYVRQSQSWKDIDPDTLGIESSPLVLGTDGTGSLSIQTGDNTQSPRIDFPGDRDVFQTVAVDDGPITFTADGTTSNIVTTLRVYDANRNLLATDMNNGPRGTSQVSVAARRGDFFYFDVVRTEGSATTGDYAVRVSQRTP